jgi:hypothetical protein
MLIFEGFFAKVGQAKLTAHVCGLGGCRANPKATSAFGT